MGFQGFNYNLQRVEGDTNFSIGECGRGEMNPVTLPLISEGNFASLFFIL